MEVEVCPPEGFTHSSGEKVPPNKVTAHGLTNRVRVEYSLEAATNSYKFLELEKSPTFVVFDMEGAVFKTDSEEELIDFLKKNNPNKK